MSRAKTEKNGNSLAQEDIDRARQAGYVMSRRDDFDASTQTRKPGGSRGGGVFREKEGEHTFLIKKGGGYASLAIQSFGITVDHVEEISAIKECYAAAVYGVMTGQSELVRYRLVTEHEGDQRIAVASQMIPHARMLRAEQNTQDKEQPVTPQIIQSIPDKTQLAEILIASMILGDADVKSENMLAIGKEPSNLTFARIDFGYGFDYSNKNMQFKHEDTAFTSKQLVSFLKASLKGAEAKEFAALSDDMFTPEEIQRAQSNIRARVEANAQQLEAIHQVFCPLLESYRALDPENTVAYLGKETNSIPTMLQERVGKLPKVEANASPWKPLNVDEAKAVEAAQTSPFNTAAQMKAEMHATRAHFESKTENEADEEHQPPSPK